MRRLLPVLLLSFACSQAGGQRGVDGVQGPPGPAGPSGAVGAPGTRGPRGAGATLIDANNQLVGVFISSSEVLVPSMGCSVTIVQDDGLGDQRVDGQPMSMFFTSTDCTGTPFVNVSVYSTPCWMARSEGSPIGGKPIGGRAQKLNAFNARYFRFQSPLVRETITANSRLDESGFCIFLDPTTVRAFVAAEVQLPNGVAPLSIVVE